jgi:hypothetical protein
MYAIYFKDTMKLVMSAVRGSQVVTLGKRLSRKHGREVVAYHNGDDGNTALCCTFKNGECIVEGPFSPLCEPPASGDDWGPTTSPKKDCGD